MRWVSLTRGRKTTKDDGKTFSFHLFMHVKRAEEESELDTESDFNLETY